MPRLFQRPGPLGASRKGDKEPGPAAPQAHGRFRMRSLLQGSRSWNLPIEYLRASTAAQSLCLLLASRFSFTINSSKTTPSAANSAKPSECAAIRRFVPRPEPPVRSAELKPLFLSSQPRAGPYSVAAASRSRASSPSHRKAPADRHNWSGQRSERILPDAVRKGPS